MDKNQENEARTGVPLIEAKGINKSFGAVCALKDGNLTIRGGEVHALVGGNGAGKSTMVKILSGVYHPDGGEILFKGKQVNIHSPKEASELGIATVHQTLGLIDHLDVTANLFLGKEIRRPAPWSWFGILNQKAMRKFAVSELERLNIGLPSVDALIARMSGGQRQAIAVARALAGSKPIIIMDEPTAALGVRESADVMRLMELCCREGAGVLLISHNIEEIFSAAHRITVFRLGETVACVNKKDVTPHDIVGLITGATAVDKSVV